MAICFKLILNRVLSFKETEIAKSVYVRAIPDRRLGARRYDIEFPNVLITAFLFLLRFPFTLPSAHGVWGEGLLSRKGVITGGSYGQPTVGVDLERGWKRPAGVKTTPAAEAEV